MAADRDSNSNTKKISAYPFEVTVDQLAAIAEQRRREKETDLQRQAMHIGSLFVAASGEPGSDGRYGLYTAEQIATQLRPWVAMGAEFLAQQGQPLANGVAALTPLLEYLSRGNVSSEGTREEASVIPLAPTERGAGTEHVVAAQNFIPDANTLGTLGLDESTIL